MEQAHHINVLEMKAVLYMLKTRPPLLRGTIVSWHSNNKTVLAYLLKEGGTRSWTLCLITKEVFHILDKWGISLRPAYLKGLANKGTDALSRSKEILEWCLAPSVA